MAKAQLSGDIEARLTALSKARDTTPRYLMKTAIERFLDIEEALEAERQLVLARWEKFEITGETQDHDVVKSWAACLPPQYTTHLALKCINGSVCVQAWRAFWG